MIFFMIPLLFLFGCSTKPHVSTYPQVVFIHGSHFDGSSWSDVRKNIVKKIGSVAPTTGNKSLYDAARFYCDQIKNKAVVVGHSYGGAIANQMSAYCDKKIQRIIYIAAVSPHNEEMSFDLLSVKDQEVYSSIVNFTEKLAEPKEKRTFLNVMAGAKVNADKIAIFPEAITIGSEKLKLDQAVLNKIPKNYIFTENDSIIEIASQKKYAQREKNLVTRTIKSGHLPMVTNSKELSEIIIDFVSSSK